MRKKTPEELLITYNNSHKPGSQTVISGKLAGVFLDAASAGDIPLMRKFLTSEIITVKSVSNPVSLYAFLGGSSCELTRRPVVDTALFRLSNNLPGLKMLLEEFEVPLPPDFLSFVENREIAEYLINVHGLNPYEKARKMEKRSDDGDCSYFSAENVKRLHAEQYRRLRPADYAIIGDTLNRLANVLITEVKSGHVHTKPTANGEVVGSQAPHFECASHEDAIALGNFLRNECALDFYTTSKGSCIVYSRESLPENTCDHSNFIMAVGKKAGIYQELAEEQDQHHLVM